jgi:hypothetical protein
MKNSCTKVLYAKVLFETLDFILPLQPDVLAIAETFVFKFYQHGRMPVIICCYIIANKRVSRWLCMREHKLLNAVTLLPSGTGQYVYVQFKKGLHLGTPVAALIFSLLCISV